MPKFIHSDESRESPRFYAVRKNGLYWLGTAEIFSVNHVANAQGCTDQKTAEEYAVECAWHDRGSSYEVWELREMKRLAKIRFSPAS